MDFSNVKKITISAGEVKQIEVNGVVVWKGGYTNLVPSSINADGSIYNGKGYKEKTRVRSGGLEADFDDASTTGFIKVHDGAVVRLSGWTFGKSSAGNGINVADGSFANLGQRTMQPAYYGVLTAANSPVTEEDGVYTFVVPSGLNIAYIRVCGYDVSFMSKGPGESMIVTVNEEIT